MDGYVYLIGEENNNGRYKIGSTKNKDVNKRIKQLQTGNSNKLIIKASYQTERPFKLESMLHNKFSSKHINGEWFELSEEEVYNFWSTCDNFQKIIDVLKENPFF